MKILLPVDGSDFTKRMLDYLAAHQELLGPHHEYLAFTAVTPIPPHLSHYLDRGVIGQYHQEEAEKILTPIKSFAEQQHWRLFTSTYEAGHATDAIVAFAHKERPDLIVMGTHGHSALGSLVLGSVTNGVLARSKVPVLLIR